MVSRGRDSSLSFDLRALNGRGAVCPSSLCLILCIHGTCLSPALAQGFQVVCEAAQSDSSSPTAGEQSCRRGNSVEKGGPSQQPPPAKGPSKKK